jgi:hypothetical protein
MTDLDTYLGKSFDSIYRRAREIQYNLNTKQAKLTAISELLALNLSSSREELDGAYKRSLEELTKEYAALSDNLRTHSERSREAVEEKLKTSQEMLAQVSELARNSLELRHSYAYSAEFLGKINQHSQKLDRAEAKEGRLDYSLSTFKGLEPAAHLGQFNWSQLSLELDAAHAEELQIGTAQIEEAKQAQPDLTVLLGDFSKTSCHDVEEEERLMRSGSIEDPELLAAKQSEQVQMNLRAKRVLGRQRPSTAIWSYSVAYNRFKDYSFSDNRDIEEAYQSKRPYMELKQHSIDFGLMQQINHATKKVRKVQRREK